MNVFLRLGQWVEKHFPEKITTAQVLEVIELYKEKINAHGLGLQLLNDRLSKVEYLNRELSTLKEQFDLLKNQVTIRTRITPPMTPSAMTPFASRASAGGNESPR